MNKIITIGRQYGSGGREIGKKVAELCSVPFYDKDFISRAASDSGFCEELIETQLSRLERVRSDRDLARRAAAELRWELDRYTGPRHNEFLRRLAAINFD